MKDFFIFFDHLKFLFENELYEDAKLLADLLIGIMETKGMLCDPKDKYMVYYYYGISAFELRDFKLAESLFNKALQMNKSNLRPKPKAVSSFDCETDLKIKYNLYMCLVNDKKYQEAFNILDSIPAKQRSPKILFALAKLCHKSLPNEEAVNIYKEVLKASKLSLISIDALLSLGVKFDELPKLPFSMNVEWLNLYLKGKGHMNFKEFKESAQLFAELDSKFLNKSSDVLAALASSQFAVGDYSNACVTFEKLHRLEPAVTSKMDIYAYLLYIDKSDRDKLNSLEKLANDMHTISTTIPETWTTIGYYCLKKKTTANKNQSVGENVKCFVDNALGLDAQNQQALLLKAIAYSKYKPMEAAIAYKEVIRVNQCCFEAYKGLVDSLLNLSHVKDAIQIAGNAVKCIGSNARTFALYGEALSRDSSTQEKSKTYLYKAIKSDPDNQEAVISLVKVCMALQQYQEALDVLGKFIRYNSSNHRLLHLYVELMKKFKRNDEVIMYLNKMSGMDPNNLEIKKMLEKAEQSMETSHDDSIQNIQVI